MAGPPVSPPWPATLTKLPEGALSPRLASARGSPTRKIAGQGAAKPSPAGPGCGFTPTPREESGPAAPPKVEIEYFFRVRFSTKAQNRRFPRKSVERCFFSQMDSRSRARGPCRRASHRHPAPILLASRGGSGRAPRPTLSVAKFQTE